MEKVKAKDAGRRAGPLPSKARPPPGGVAGVPAGRGADILAGRRAGPLPSKARPSLGGVAGVPAGRGADTLAGRGANINTR